MKITKKLIDRMLMFIFYIALVGLIFTPVLPWITEDVVGEESMTWISKMEISNSENENISSINSNINYASTGFGFGILFALVGRVGVVARKIKKKLLANYLILSSIPILFSSAVALVFSVRVLFMINKLGDPYGFGYNYVHISLAIPLFFVSLLFAYITVPRARKGIKIEKKKEYFTGPKTDLGDMSQRKSLIGYTKWSEPEDEEDENKDIVNNYTCIRCGEEVESEALLCRKCGNNLSVKCPSCDTIYAESKEECPKCGMSPYDLRELE